MADGGAAAVRRLGLVPLAWLALFTFVPLVFVVAIAFAGRGSPVTWTFDGGAWARLLEPRWLTVLGRSAATALATTAICAVLAVPVSWHIARRTERVRRVLYFLVLVPLWANTVALLGAWIVILRGDGLLDRALRSAGLLGEDGTSGLLYTRGAVLLGMVYALLPYMAYAVHQSVERFDLRLLEAARDLGATRAQAIRRVLLPCIRPGIVAGSVLVFVPALATFVVPDMLGGARAAHVGDTIRDRMLMHPTDWPLGCAMAVVLVALTAVSAHALGRTRREG